MVTRVVNTHDAKSRLSELIREAEEGIEVIVARNGHPVAKIVPWKPERPTRVPGAWAGRVHGSDDAVSSDDEVVALFEESAAGNAP
jgi:prevent-host-death family protein